MSIRIKVFVFVVFAVICMVSKADAIMINFDSLANGEEVTTQFSGLTISAENYHPSHPDKAITFDSTLSGTRDRDLEDPWSGGNISNVILNNMLIIAENDRDRNNDGLVDRPDDEGRRPAGAITFLFTQHLNSFGFDFIDVDNKSNGAESPDDYTFDFFSGSSLVNTVSLGDFEDSASLFYDPTIVHKNNYANRYSPITSVEIGGTFDKVVANFAGSGAIDTLIYTFDDPVDTTTTIPEPATMILLGSGLFGAFLKNKFNLK